MIAVAAFATGGCQSSSADDLAAGNLVYGEVSALAMDTVANRFIARLDFDGDGLDDLLVGGNHGGSLAPTPVMVLRSLGDGRLVDATADHLLAPLSCRYPVGVQADFNGDGIDDVAVFDAGNPEQGQAPEGGFYGAEPWLLLSRGAGAWAVSDALVQAVANAPDHYCWPSCGTTLHVKSATAGDIDGDGDIDMYVESGGGFENPNPHFLLNRGDETFELDASDERRSNSIVWGDTGSWRYATHRLVDMNGDGALDLVMGQLRKIDNGQNALTNKIAFNDGLGRFRQSSVEPLPHAAWNGGYTYVKAMAIADLTGDGRPDLVLSHQRGNVTPDPVGVGNTGRYLQVLIAADNAYLDQSNAWLGDQSSTTEALVEPYGSNYNTPESVELLDLDGDGDRDLVMAGAGPVGDHAPYAYLATEPGTFAALSAAAISRRDWYGNGATPIDLDGDGRLDLVHTDLRPGDDGVYGTEDDRSRIVSNLSSTR